MCSLLFLGKGQRVHVREQMKENPMGRGIEVKGDKM